jgi:hypothetical protein
MQVLDSIENKIVLELEKHEQAERIKKLIFCVCKNYWENDLSLINTIYLKHLIQELIELNSTQEQLHKSVYQIVNLLNRKEVYTSVANTIINKVGKLYYKTDRKSKSLAQQEPAIQEDNNEPIVVNNGECLIDKITMNLEEDPNSARIKKIVFALCKNEWENDSEIIDRYDFNKLIQELYQNNSTLEELERSIYNLIKTLNRQSLYLLVAQRVIREMEYLYKNSKIRARPVNVERKSKKISKETSIISDFSKQTYLFDELFKPSEYLEEKSNLEPETNSQPVEESESSATQNNSYNPFDLRLEVMKYGNPLRVKILAFSLTYHQFDNSSNDWSLLQTCTVDDLLFKLLQTYPTIAELEEQIYATAKKLKDSDEYLQPAGAIVQSMRPIYANKSK